MPERRVVRRLLLLLLFFVGLFPVAFFSIVELGLAESTSSADSAGVETPGNIDRFVENDAFGVGEKLTFHIGRNGHHGSCAVDRIRGETLLPTGHAGQFQRLLLDLLQSR
jgi:hypothetical protein